MNMNKTRIYTDDGDYREINPSDTGAVYSVYECLKDGESFPEIVDPGQAPPTCAVSLWAVAESEFAAQIALEDWASWR
jgi:hypothetical protein